MIARQLYTELGGLRNVYVQGDYEDSDLCLRLIEAGLTNWYQPAVELYHLEGQSYEDPTRGNHLRYKPLAAHPAVGSVDPANDGPLPGLPAPVTASAKGPRPLFEVVQLPHDPATLWGHNLEMPTPSSPRDSPCIEIGGWVLGRRARAVAIELQWEDRLIGRQPLRISRPDVQAHYPHVTGAGAAGYRICVTVGRSAPTSLTVRVVLADQTRVDLARVRAGPGALPARPAPLCSVVIPCFNQARFLGEAIESAFTQTHPNLEVVVIDDGSSDNTVQIARRYPSCRVIRQDNRGPAAARNAGLAAANGEFVLFLDADDRLLPEAVSTGVRLLQTHSDCGFAAGGCTVVDTGGSVLFETPRLPPRRCDARDFLRGNSIFTPGAVVFRRSTLIEAGGFDEEPAAKGCEDYALYLRIVRQGSAVQHPDRVVRYRRHAANASAGAVRMLKASLHVLTAQRPWVGPTPALRGAFRVGLAAWRDRYGERTVEATRRAYQERDYATAGSGIAALVRHYPAGLVSLLWAARARRTRLRRVVEHVACASSPVIIVGDEPLESSGRRQMRLQTSEMRSADTLIAGLERLRDQGGEILLVPRSSDWWLLRHPEVEWHLDRRYQRAWSSDACVAWDLTEGRCP